MIVHEKIGLCGILGGGFHPYRDHPNQRCGFQQGRARVTRLRNELCSDSFNTVLALSCGQAKCQCCIAAVTVVVYLDEKGGKRSVKMWTANFYQSFS